MSLLKRLPVVALVLVFGVAMVGMASADTVDMNETECNDADNYWYEDTCYTTENEKLNAQIVSLNDRIDELLTMLSDQEEEEEPSPAEGNVPEACKGVEFDRSLDVGMEGEDVKCLQTMLNQD